MQAITCSAGSHLSFNGVRLAEEAKPGYAVNLVVPEDGQDHLTFDSPGHRPIVIPQTGCSVWRVDIHHNRTENNVTEDQEVHARFDCTESGQVHISGYVDRGDCE